MTASTDRDPRPSSNDPTVHTDARRPGHDPATGPVHAVPAPQAPAAPVETKAARARRVVSMKVAAIIGIVAFLLGAGVALLVGGLTGPGGTPPNGTGGPGGAPGTSQSSSTTTGTGTSSTAT